MSRKSKVVNLGGEERVVWECEECYGYFDTEEYADNHSGCGALADKAGKISEEAWDKIDEAVEENYQKNAKYKPGREKQSYACVPGYATEQLAKAMANGADKYGLYNWRETGVDMATYYDAIQRHMQAWFHKGQEGDTDSGLHPLAHVMACCALVLDALNEGKLHDNRPVSKGAVYTKAGDTMWRAEWGNPNIVNERDGDFRQTEEYYYQGSRDPKGDE